MQSDDRHPEMQAGSLVGVWLLVSQKLRRVVLLDVEGRGDGATHYPLEVGEGRERRACGSAQSNDYWQEMHAGMLWVVWELAQPKLLHLTPLSHLPTLPGTTALELLSVPTQGSGSHVDERRATIATRRCMHVVWWACGC